MNDLERLTTLLDDFGLKYVEHIAERYVEIVIRYSRMWLVFIFEDGDFKYMCMDR